jgi:N4-gp56 family major capsid protein
MAVSTTTQVPPGVQAFYDRNLLTRATPNEVHGRYGQKRPISKKSGNQIKFRKYSALAAATTPLTEGTTPGGSSLAVTDITATLAQYGDFITLSDVVDMVNQDAVVTEATDVLGDQAGLTIDQVRRDVLVAGTNVAYANAVAARVNVNVKLATTDLDKAIRYLKNQNAKFMREGMPASTGVGTGAIRKAYVAVCHPDTEFDLEALTGFRAVSDYPSQESLLEDEIGSYKNIRFVSSTNCKIFAGGGAAGTTVYKNNGANFDVYATLIFAADAYGICPLSGEAMKTYVKGLGSAGSADPLEQRSTVGWKAMTTTKILNESWMIRLEHAASL